MKKIFLTQTLMLTLMAALVPGLTLAHGETHQSTQRKISTEEMAFGREGDPKKVTRTVQVDMSDRMRFTPAAMAVKQGETVKFIIRNSGKVMHEFVLGSMKELKVHAELMKRHPGMEHDEPYMVHVAPGKTGTIVWQFTRGGDFHFGCLIPGHFEAGMIGRIEVK